MGPPVGGVAVIWWGVMTITVTAVTRGNPSDVSEAVAFLSRFGYLAPPSAGGADNLLSEGELRASVLRMQAFGNLPLTGRLDTPTMQLMRRRRCGVQDVMLPGAGRRRYAIQGQKWPKTHLTWSVRSDGDASVRIQLRNAFGVWSRASALTFTELDDDDGIRTRAQHRHKADIVVSFLKGQHGDGYPFDGEGSVLAHAFFPGEGIGGDAHFDAEERWTETKDAMDQGSVNLFAVAAHEIGHSLGLSHSSQLGSLMFPYYQVLDQESFTLPRDDTEGIRHLYGSKIEKKDTTSTTPVPTTATPTTVHYEVTTDGSTTTIAPQKKDPVDVCRSPIDAISLIRREIFVFKDNYFWRLHANRTLRSGYPVSIDRFWPELGVERIDALYERPNDTKIVFFAGRRHWLFSANRMEPGYPKPLTSLGLPEDLKRVDAALVWGHNGRTYLFGGDLYWKMDEADEKVELDYPRETGGVWRGVPHPLDAAFQWTDGNSYFFQGEKFWKFVDAKMNVEKKSPAEIGGFWFQCPSKTVDPVSPTIVTTTTDRSKNVQQHAPSNASKQKTASPWHLYLLFILTHIWLNRVFVANDISIL